MPRDIGDDILGFGHDALLTLNESRVDQVAHGADQRLVIGQWRDHGAVASLAHGRAADNKPGGGYQEPCARYFCQPTVAQCA